MKKILITGANSYIGTSFEEWLKKYPDDYRVDTVGTKNEEWKEKDFSGYDVVFHVAGIAHVKETKKNAALYYKVNRDLAYEVAQKSKSCGVKQFIFLSSMSVYGMETGIIYRDTIPNPKNNYGKSKLQAEKLIELLQDEEFLVSILRPPMVYGKGCKGNYARLAKLAVKVPMFPNIENERSMIYIDNLSEFVRLLIDNGDSGMFFPQNEEYVCTSEMVKIIAEVYGKKIKFTRVFNPIIKMLGIKIELINKVFGNLVYDKSVSSYENSNYCISYFRHTVYKSEE